MLISCSVSWFNRSVARAYAIVFLTIFRSGFHVCGSDAALPPRAVERQLFLLPNCCSSCPLWLSHLGHRNMKCLTVSLSVPQEHLFDSTAPIRYRYPFRRGHSCS